MAEKLVDWTDEHSVVPLADHLVGYLDVLSADLLVDHWDHWLADQ